MHISPTNAQRLMRSMLSSHSCGGWSWCGPLRARICSSSAVLMHTEMLALLPRPAPIGMVERSVYTHGGTLRDASDRKRYRKEKAEAWWILRTDSGALGDTSS